MFCRKCGSKLNEGDAFCSKCGEPVGGEIGPAGKAKGQSQNVLEPFKRYFSCFPYDFIVIVLAILAIVFSLTLPLFGFSGLASGAAGLLGLGGLAEGLNQMLSLFPMVAMVGGMAGGGYGAILLATFLAAPVLAGIGIYWVIKQKRMAWLWFVVAAVIALIMGIVISMAFQGTYGLLEVGGGLVAPLIFYILCAALSAWISMTMKSSVPSEAEEGVPFKEKAAGVVRAVGNLDKKKKIILAGIAAAIVVVIAMLAVLSSYTTVDMAKLFNVTFDGVNKDGTILVKNNDPELDRVFLELAKKDNMGEFQVAEILGTIHFDMPTEGLANGQEIIVKAEYDEEAFKKAKINVRNAQRKITVSGLVEAEDQDVFEGLKVAYDGVSPFVEFELDTSGCSDFAQEYVAFETDGERYVKNGDKIVVRAVCSVEDQKEQKIRVAQKEKEFTVEKQPEYIDSLDGIDTELLRQDMYDALRGEEQGGGSGMTFINTFLSGYYSSTIAEYEKSEDFMVLKDADDYTNMFFGSARYNSYQLYVECEVATRSWFGTSADTVSVYVALIADNIYKDEEGKLYWDTVSMYSSDDLNELRQLYLESKGDQYTITGQNKQEDTGASPPGEASQAPAANAMFDGNGFVFPDSDKRYLSEDEIWDKAYDIMEATQNAYGSEEIFGFMRNEIYARHGNQFKTQKYIDHYSQYGWYQALVKHQVQDNELNQYELQNIQVLLQCEEVSKNSDDPVY